MGFMFFYAIGKHENIIKGGKNMEEVSVDVVEKVLENCSRDKLWLR